MTQVTEHSSVQLGALDEKISLRNLVWDEEMTEICQWS